MDQGPSFDLRLSDHAFQQNKGDHIDRIKHQVKLLENENQQLQTELNYIKNNPHELIKSFQIKLLSRIAQLRQQNEGIEQLIEKSKIPGYAEMTKKKQSYITQTPGKQKKMMTQRQQDQQSNFGKKNLFQQVQMSEKGEISTCQNFPIQLNTQNPLGPLQPLQDHEIQSRVQLTAQLFQVIDRTTMMTSQMQKIVSQSNNQRNQNSMRLLAQNNKKLEQIARYKQKLLQLLKKLKVRQNNQQQIVREYQVMYDETLKKFQQATVLLNQLSSIKTDKNLDDLYAEVLQLEQRLNYINEQLQKIDETQWLKDIQTQLHHALKRLAISPPEFKPSCQNLSPNQILRERIDALAQILIQCSVSHKADQKQKLILLKLYYDEEKENNKKIIKSLQNKQQGLSKKLIDLQMNN